MILCLVETQLPKNRVEGLRFSLGFDFSFGVGSSGRSGGICIFWKNSMDVSIKNFSRYHVDAWVKEPLKEQWRLSCFYGEANRSLRYKTWDMMTRLRGESTLPWLCIGDFNEILRKEEQMGVHERDSAQMEAFREATDLCALADLGYKGLDWTWEKKVSGGHYCRVRLDRALASASWSTLFPLASVEHLTAAKSDHSPILLATDLVSESVRAAQRPFRYECMWERDGRFGSVLENAWKSKAVAQSVFDFSEKLANLATDLQQWGRHTFGSVRHELRQLRKKLEELRAAPMRVGPSTEEEEVEARMVELCCREEIMWRQRARIQWLAEGDSNTKFFHKKASARKAKNHIMELQRADGSMTSDQEEMAAMATSFYENLYASQNTIGLEEVISHIPVKVNGQMITMLNAPYTKEEVKSALFQMFPTKAPGPDGFPAHFFQRHWDLCGEEVTDMVLRVLSGDDSPEEINKTFIVLIPKIASPKKLA